jgi:hypothetical protein
MITIINKAYAQTKVGGNFDAIGNFAPQGIVGGSGDASGVFERFASSLFGFLTTVAGIWFLIYFVIEASNGYLPVETKEKSKKLNTNSPMLLSA